MKAMVYTAPLTLELLEVDEPAVTEGEVLIKVTAAGICGSELEGFASQSPFRRPPLIMGHEFAGIRVADAKAVVVNPLVACGQCDLCLRGLPNVCRHRRIIGIQRDGGFAEYVAVPAANCHLLDDAAPSSTAALIEPLANSVHAVRLALRSAPDVGRIGVIGAGMLGVAMTIVAKAMTEASVTVTDLSRERLAVAESAGADSLAETLVGEYDVVFDAVGLGQTRRAAVESIRPGGTAVFLGLHSDDPGFDGRDIIRNEKQVIGSFCYTDADFSEAVPLRSAVRPEWLDERPLDEGVEAFTELLESVPTTIKTVLLP